MNTGVNSVHSLGDDSAYTTGSVRRRVQRDINDATGYPDGAASVGKDARNSFWRKTERNYKIQPRGC